MAPVVQGQGDTLVDAVCDALASLLNIDADAVDLRLPKGAAKDFPGTAELHINVNVKAPAPAAARIEKPKAVKAAPPRQERAAATPVVDEPVDPAELDAEADAAADFLEGLLDALELPGDLKIKIHEDFAEIEIVELGDGVLIGRRGQTLEAVQELLRSAMQREFQRRSRVVVDVEGYRARRLEKLEEKAKEAVDETLRTGESVRLEPMDAFERKAIHRLVADIEGVESRSQGRDPARRIVIEPA
ncbi:MAG: R3H domain-containing nucleic acid-binding protein [Nitriliruptoraceae bacterium]